MKKASRSSSILAVVVMLLPVSGMAQSSASNWADTLSLNGDLRIRYEEIYKDGSDDRERFRYRGRLALATDVSDDLSVVIGFATGGDNPVSTNQDFGDGFSTKDIGLNLLYMNWKINDEFRFSGGKMKQPWYRTGSTSVMWDGDLTPEGAAITYKRDKVFASAGTFVVQERSSDSNAMLFYGQAGSKLALNHATNVVFGAGYFEYTDTVGNEPFHNGRAKGNTVDANGNYVFDYKIVELFSNIETKVGGLPLTVFAEWLQNTDVDDQDSAYSIGATLGKAKKQGTMQLSYAYHDTDADAVIGTFSDSDFAGGFTDSNGHMIVGKYALRDNLQFGFTVILSEFGKFTGNQTDYDRVMLDFAVKF